MNLTLLKRGTQAIIETIETQQDYDPIAERLYELGFIPGESLKVIAFGPSLRHLLGNQGRHTIAVQVGFTRFALRYSEAVRIRVHAHSLKNHKT